MRISDLSIIYPDERQNASVHYLVDWLDFINRFSNINKQLTELNAVAYMIYKDYKNLYLSDLKIIFEKLMRGEFGPFYGSVDAQRILMSFLIYNVERNKAIRNKKIKLETELEKYLDNVRKEVDTEVRKILKEKYPDLTGPDYWDKRKELEQQLLPSALHESREKFLKEYETIITNGNHTTTQN